MRELILRWEVFPDVRRLSRHAAWHFVRGAAESELRGESFNVALAGGRTPRTLYALLADGNEPFRGIIPWKRVHFFWSDERFVPHDHADSNFRMARETLLDRVPIPRSNIHPMPTSAPALEGAAREYERLLRRRLTRGGRGLPRLDLLILGMGADGHTASLFPGSAALEERKALVAPVRVEGLNSHRLSLTLPVLNNAARIVFLVAGRGKAAAAAAVLSARSTSRSLPARRVRPKKGELHWLLDEAAAGELPRGALGGL